MSGLSAEDREALLNGVVICGLTAIHNPNCGHVVGNKFIRSPREGDRLAGCCHRLGAVVDPPAIASLIAAALTEASQYVELVALIHETYRHLVMDTPEDRRLHAKQVEIADRALALARRNLTQESRSPAAPQQQDRAHELGGSIA